MSIQNRGVDPLYATTTLIRYPNDHGSATGFFFTHEDHSFIITNRHVVDPEDIALDQARIHLRDQTDIGNVNSFSVDLSGGEGSAWFGHPESSDVDVAVIPINPVITPIDEIGKSEATSGNLAFTRDHYIHENITVDERVSIVGYPGNFTDRSTYFPVKRNALISSPYGVFFNNDPIFVTDARMHPGTSGSPVVMSTGGMMRSSGEVPSNRSKSIYLLGIHSATFYSFETQDDLDDTSQFRYDLNAAWYPQIIDDILASI